MSWSGRQERGSESRSLSIGRGHEAEGMYAMVSQTFLPAWTTTTACLGLKGISVHIWSCQITTGGQLPNSGTPDHCTLHSLFSTQATEATPEAWLFLVCHHLLDLLGCSGKPLKCWLLKLSLLPKVPGQIRPSSSATSLTVGGILASSQGDVVGFGGRVHLDQKSSLPPSEPKAWFKPLPLCTHFHPSFGITARSDSYHCVLGTATRSQSVATYTSEEQEGCLSTSITLL